MSGESLRAMILRVESMVTVVLNGGNSSKLCQPSSKAARRGRWLASGRPGRAGATLGPRPRRGRAVGERGRGDATLRSGAGVGDDGAQSRPPALGGRARRRAWAPAGV